MKDRPYLKTLLQWAITAAIAFIAAKYGINIPPPPPPPQAEPAPVPPSQPERKPDTLAAISRLTMGNSGCTATPVGDQRPDGRYWVLTASHCVQSVGQRGKLTTRRGDVLTVTVQGLDRRSDCAWLLTDSTTLHLPFAELADAPPAPGTKIWHAGFGVHIPGNREEGTFVSGPDSNGQLRMHLSVSSGDSGGAICLDADNRIISCVCCTSARGQRADVWGAGPVAIRALRDELAVFPGWIPTEVPLREDFLRTLEKKD